MHLVHIKRTKESVLRVTRTLAAADPKFVSAHSAGKAGACPGYAFPDEKVSEHATEH